MRAVQAFLILMPLSAFSAGAGWGAQPEARAGSMEIAVTDTYGQPLKSFRIEIRPVHGQDARPKVLTAPGRVELPYGEYVITGEASLHQPFVRRVLLQEPHLVVLAGFAFRDSGHSAIVNTPLTGRVEGGRRGSGDTLVRAAAIWGPFEKEARVGQDGRFEMQGVPYGEYMLLVLRGGELIAWQRFVKTPREEQATIDLGMESGRQAREE